MTIYNRNIFSATIFCKTLLRNVSSEIIQKLLRILGFSLKTAVLKYSRTIPDKSEELNISMRVGQVSFWKWVEMTARDQVESFILKKCFSCVFYC